jgi:hypothetical protein
MPPLTDILKLAAKVGFKAGIPLDPITAFIRRKAALHRGQKVVVRVKF